MMMSHFLIQNIYYTLTGLKQMQVEECTGIESEFLVANKYREVCNQSRRRNTLVRNYLELVEQVFKAYQEYYEETQESVRMRSHEKSIYIAEFKVFLKKFAEIIRETSQLQIGCITEIKMASEDILVEPMAEIVNKVQQCADPQKTLRRNIERFNELHTGLTRQYASLKNECQDPVVFFTPKFMVARARSLRSSMEELQSLQTGIEKSKREVGMNALDFEQSLLFFRKRLVKNKYVALGQMLDYSKHFQNSFIEVMLFLYECTAKRMEVFLELKKNPREDIISMAQSKGKRRAEDREVISNIVSSVQEYNQTIDEIHLIFNVLDESFRRLSSKVNKVMETHKKTLMENINSLYDLEESPSIQVLQTLELFSNFTVKIANTSDKIYESQQKLNLLKSNVKKHVDVTLSILRMSPIGSVSQWEAKSPQVDALYEQISYDYLTDIFHEVYKCFKGVMTDIKTEFSQKYYKKKKSHVENSMELSHMQETVLIAQKKPCKEEIWMWKNWMDKVSFNYQDCNKLLAHMDKELSKIESPPESKELEKLHCVLENKKNTKGVLRVCEDYLQFISLGSDSIQVFIPFSSISSVESRVRLIEKALVVKTTQGEVYFTKFPDIDRATSTVQSMIKEPVQGNLVRRSKIKLTPEQVEFLSSRKNEIQSNRPPINDMIKIGEIFVDNIDVDEVYEFIYDDQPFTLRGKQEDSFFAFCMKKAGNSNYTISPYDSPGPQFYSRIESVKFTNCPLTSSRSVEFDHPLPPIPFMPKFCHCKEVGKMYWVSNEEFDYETLSESSGAPYTDTFIARTVHIVARKGSGVVIQIYGQLNFVKETSMKGMLKSKGEKEMVDGGRETLKEIEKTLAIVSGASSLDEVVGQDQNPDQQVTGKSVSEMERLRSQNKALIGCLLGLLLINFLYKIIFN